MLNTRNTLIAAAILALGASAWAQGSASGALKQPAPPVPASAPAAMPSTPAPAASDSKASRLRRSAPACVMRVAPRWP